MDERNACIQNETCYCLNDRFIVTELRTIISGSKNSEEVKFHLNIRRIFLDTVGYIFRRFNHVKSTSDWFQQQKLHAHNKYE